MSKTLQNIKLAVDAIVFGYQQNELNVLLIKQKFDGDTDQWALPGGLVQNEESLTEAVNRELLEETGIQLQYLEQLYTFGDQLDRDHRGRVVTVAYFGIVNPKGMEPAAGSDADEAHWFPISEVPILAFDHTKILDVALTRLQAKLNYQPIGFDLLDEQFPFSDLESLYRTILGKEIDRRNFRKKILSFGILEETNEKRKIGSGRPATLFKFNKNKYKELEQEGFSFEIKFA